MSQSDTTTTTSLTSTSTTTTTKEVTTQKTFTLEELSSYNGDGGGFAYIAVSGIVYDVTNVKDWSNGWHKGMHLAGTDCTSVFASSPHSQSLLNTLTIVGILAN